MIVVLRLGHRPSRDKRVTTHVALTARAFGADEIWVSTKDAKLEKTVDSVVSRFGGDFAIRTDVRWREAIRSWHGDVVHLTVYGEPLDSVVPSLSCTDLLIVVGAEKVPREVYELATRNVSVGNQPHSEIGALAVFLDRLTGGATLYEDRGGSMRILPNPRGKTVVDEEGRERRIAKQG
ncbi:MAG: tRNA (cytidine(56)-2'-O)-methyltransferase [Methanobacteriota archaeon]|nr:MAG: tRNA (cytidine(56)-2'-O)-methyltransferase [Euryarchaeota archaeon]